MIICPRIVVNAEAKKTTVSAAAIRVGKTLDYSCRSLQIIRKTFLSRESLTALARRRCPSFRRLLSFRSSRTLGDEDESDIEI